MRSDARGYPWWPGAVCSTQGPDTEAQDQSLPLSRFSLQRTAGPYKWVTPGRTQLEHIESASPLICADRSLVDKNEPGRIKKTLLSYPTSACSRNVLSLPFSSLQAFLRNGDAGGWVNGLEYEAEGLGSAM